MATAEAASSIPPSTVRHSSLWLFAVTFSLLLGQLSVASPLDAPAWLWGIPSGSSLLLVFLQRRRAALLVLIASVAFGIGHVRHSRALAPQFPLNHLRSVMDEKVEINLEGVLANEPEKLSRRTRWLLRSERIWHPTGAEEIVGSVQITLRNATREWRYGDRVRFAVRVVTPRATSNPGGFDYASFLARRQVYLTGYLDNDSKVELVHRGGAAGLWGSVERVRRVMRRFFEQHFSQESGAMLKALVLGDRGGISKAMRDEFVAAGVAHLLAISGLHVGMLAAVVFTLVRFVGSFSTVLLLRFNLVKIATCCSLAAVFFYTAIAGAMIPSVRAAIMIAAYGLAVLLDREDEIWNSLALAALVIALYWPGAIVEPSFQLSFLAVLFIVWGLRKIHEWIPPYAQGDLPQERSRWRPWARKGGLYLAVPALATLGTGPMIAHHFGYLSLAGFLANPVLVPIFGFVVVPLGLFTGFVSLVAPSIGATWTGIVETLCGWAYGGVRLFAGIPMAKIAVPIPNPLELALLYGVILGLFLARRKAHVALLLGAAALSALLVANYWRQERWQRTELRVTFLSVGHGDAAVIELPGSKVLLIDAGGTASGEFDTGEAIVAPFLRSRKIMKVDYLLVSHARVDHYGGMRTIVKEFAPSELWSGSRRGRTARFEDLEEAVRTAGIKRVILSDGHGCREIEQVKLCVLYPGADPSGDASVVLRLSFGRVDLLFPGDIERREEKALLTKPGQLASVVLKVPRHGSSSSSTEEFVTAVKPKLAIFSVGQRNPFGLPREEVVARYRATGAEILRTDVDGAIIVESDGETGRYRTHRSGKRGTVGF